MKLLDWPGDTIAVRFALTTGLAIGVSVSLMILFFIFGGTWAQPDVESSGLPELAASIVRTIDAVQPDIRRTITATTSTDMFHVDWYEVDTPTAQVLRRLPAPKAFPVLMARFLGDSYRSIRIFLPENPVSTIPEIKEERIKYPHSYFLAIGLTDKSWLVFTVFNRTWGISHQMRWAIFSIFCILSTGINSIFAAQQLAKPTKRLAEAVRTFGLNPQSLAIAETGPREIRQVIKTFNAMRAQIHKFVAYRTTMLAAISHDLRTPLTRMRLRGEYIEDDEQREKLFNDVDEMQAMIDGALAFFRDDAAAEAPTTLDLPGVLNTIVNDYADRDINIPYRGPAHCICWGRPFALKRAFTNLVENAVKYATPPEIELSLGEGTVLVEIRDRGPGIPLKALDRVFDPYYRLEKSRNLASGGFGLGLTAAQSIVQEHGGEIILTNRPDGGLKALVTLPMTRKSSGPDQSGRPTAI